MERHLSNYDENKFTSIAKDWELYFLIDCSTMAQALKIEAHIKRMKSRKYIENVRAYPEMVEKLKEKNPQ
jgi:putative endonuclease